MKLVKWLKNWQTVAFEKYFLEIEYILSLTENKNEHI